MSNKEKNNLRWKNSEKGYTVIELMIAALITAIITAATFNFYTTMQRQSEVQIDVSELSNLCRASLFDIRKTLHMAGNKLGAHPPYKIIGDSLAVYFSETKPVDTVLYYLEKFTADEYATVPNLPAGQKLFKLMKKRNSQPAAVFADFITDVNFILINPTTMAVTITAQASHKDNTYSANGGFRNFSLSERINMRYLELIS